MASSDVGRLAGGAETLGADCVGLTGGEAEVGSAMSTSGLASAGVVVAPFVFAITAPGMFAVGTSGFTG